MKIYAVVSDETWEAPSIEQPYYFKHEDAVKKLLKEVEERNIGLNRKDKFIASKHDPLCFYGENESLYIQEFEVI